MSENREFKLLPFNISNGDDGDDVILGSSDSASDSESLGEENTSDREFINLEDSESEDCMKGVEHLESHRAEWNDKLGRFNSNALEDVTVHGADAGRYVAVNFRAGNFTGKLPEPQEDRHNRRGNKQTKFLM